MRKFYNNFTAGEWSPLLLARSDLAKYSSACQRLENFRVLAYGGVTYRQGLRWLATLEIDEVLKTGVVEDGAPVPTLDGDGVSVGRLYDVRLIPFQREHDVGYVCVLTPGKLRIYSEASGHRVLKYFDAPWGGEGNTSIWEVQYAQMNDVLILVGGSFAPMELSFDGQNWTFAPVVFDYHPDRQWDYVDKAAVVVERRYSEVNSAGEYISADAARAGTMVCKPIEGYSGEVKGVFAAGDVGRQVTVDYLYPATFVEFYLCRKSQSSKIEIQSECLPFGKWIVAAEQSLSNTKNTLLMNVCGLFAGGIGGSLSGFAMQGLGAIDTSYDDFETTSAQSSVLTDVISDSNVKFSGVQVSFGDIRGVWWVDGKRNGTARKQINWGAAVADFALGIPAVSAIYTMFSNDAPSYKRPLFYADDEMCMSDMFAVYGKWTAQTTETWAGTIMIYRVLHGVTTKVREFTANGDSSWVTAGEESEPCVYFIVFLSAGNPFDLLGGTKPDSSTIRPPKLLFRCEEQIFRSRYLITEVLSDCECHVQLQNAYQQFGKMSELVRLGDWCDRTGYPRHVAFFENRLFFAGSETYRNTVWGSQIDDFFNFAGGSLDTDAVSYRYLAGEYNPISFIFGSQQLLGATIGDCFSVSSGSDAAPLTPTNVSVKTLTRNGAVNQHPLLVENSIIYVGRQGITLCESSYNFVSNEQQTVELSLLARHMTDVGIHGLTYSDEPEHVVYATASGDVDGETGNPLFVLSYDKAQQVTAWSRWITAGHFIAAQTLTSVGGRDVVYMAVQREQVAISYELRFPDADGDGIIDAVGTTTVSSPTTENVCTVDELSKLEHCLVIAEGSAGLLDAADQSGAEHPVIPTVDLAGRRWTQGLQGEWWYSPVPPFGQAAGFDYLAQAGVPYYNNPDLAEQDECFNLTQMRIRFNCVGNYAILPRVRFYVETFLPDGWKHSEMHYGYWVNVGAMDVDGFTTSNLAWLGFSLFGSGELFRWIEMPDWINIEDQGDYMDLESAVDEMDLPVGEHFIDVTFFESVIDDFYYGGGARVRWEIIPGVPAPNPPSPEPPVPSPPSTGETVCRWEHRAVVNLEVLTPPSNDKVRGVWLDCSRVFLLNNVNIDANTKFTPENKILREGEPLQESDAEMLAAVNNMDMHWREAMRSQDGLVAVADGRVIRGVQCLADCTFVFPRSVTGVRVLVIGFPYVGRVQTMPLAAQYSDGSSAERKRRVHGIMPVFYQTLGGYYGQRDDDMKRIVFRRPKDKTDATAPLFSGEVPLVFDGGHDRDGSIILEQREPSPMTILGVDVEAEFS